MNELFTEEDFIAARRFARIECSEEEGKTLKENIEKTLSLISKMTLSRDDLLLDDLVDSHLSMDFIENEISKKRSELTSEQGINLLDQDKLKFKADFLRFS